MDINFNMPVKVIMEEDCIRKNAALLKEYGTRALIVTGKRSAKINGALQDVTEALTSLGIKHFIFDKVMANPTVSCVYEGAAFAREHKADFVIGIGGGSPMDAAKAVALLAVTEIPQEQLFMAEPGSRALPIVMVPTTAGTGSEVTRNAILSSDILQTKRSIAAPVMFAKLALLDAKYMKDLPMPITVHTALDALSHAVEGMLSRRATKLSDSIAIGSIEILMECLKLLAFQKEQNISMEVREKLLYGSMLAGMVISHTGTTAVHSMGYSLTYFKNIDHGRANALLLPGFLEFVAKSKPESVKQILEAMGMNSIREYEVLTDQLLGERDGITEEEANQFTKIASEAKSITNSWAVLSKQEIYELYVSSLNRKRV